VRLGLPPSAVRSVVPNDPLRWYCLFLPASGPFADPVCNNAVHEEPFNFVDLPCPRDALRAQFHSSFLLDPAFPYAPRVAPVTQLRELWPGWSECALQPAWDPIEALTSREGGLAPNVHGGGKRGGGWAIWDALWHRLRGGHWKREEGVGVGEVAFGAGGVTQGAELPVETVVARPGPDRGRAVVKATGIGAAAVAAMVTPWVGE
jgi:hypothetical protein